MWSAGYDKERQLEEEKKKWTKASWELSLESILVVMGTVMESLGEAGGHVTEIFGLFSWDNEEIDRYVSKSTAEAF